MTGIIIAVLSLLTHLNPHGVTRVTMWIAYWLLVYLLVDLFDIGVQKRAVVAALVVSTGLLNLISLAEIAQKYIVWWQANNSIWISPPLPYRLFSLIGYSGAYMGLINLVAPFTVLLFRRTKRIIYRVGLIYWWIFYACVIIWSSSRGGLVGSIVWVATFTILWVLGNGGKGNLNRFWRRSSLVQRTILVITLFGLAIIIWLVYVFIAGHPSHGGILSGREKFWQAALMIWRQHPWLGAGPGQFGVEYLRYQSVPPKFWAVYSHSVPFQVLADLGLFGFVWFVFFVAIVARKLWLAWQHAQGENKFWRSALMASLAAFAVQNLFDDFTAIPGVMVTFCVVLALVWVHQNGRLPRLSRISLHWLSFPALIVVLLLGFAWWTYQPLKQALPFASAGDWERAALLSDISAQRAPNSPYYQTEAGLAFSRWWGETGNEDALRTALDYFKASAELEPTISVTYANLAILEWQIGQKQSAIESMSRAVELAPLEPVFWSNLGWFYEHHEQFELALSAYQRTLMLAPTWTSHPFWQSNELRQTGLSQSQLSQQPSQSAAWQAYLDGDWELAEHIILQERWSAPLSTKSMLLKGKIAEARGDDDLACAHILDMANTMVERQYVVSYSYLWFYNIGIHRRQGFSFDLVPGFLRLEPDFGQFDVLDQLEDCYSTENGMAIEAETRNLQDCIFCLNPPLGE